MPLLSMISHLYEKFPDREQERTKNAVHILKISKNGIGRLGKKKQKDAKSACRL